MIVEMAGRPAEHVKESLEKHIKVLDDVDDITLHSIKVSEPKEIEGSKGFFSSFAEVDFEVDKFNNLGNIVLDFMPSSIEVVEPANITISMKDATDMMNVFSGRLHKYDEIAKVAKFKIGKMNEELEALRKGPKKGVEKVKKKVKKKN